MKGFMVLPEHRSGPVGYAVLKAAGAELEGTLVLTVASACYRLFRALGFTEVGLLRVGDRCDARTECRLLARALFR